MTRTLIVNERPFFMLEDDEDEARVGPHGLDQLFTSRDVDVHTYVCSARTSAQHAKAACGPTRLRMRSQEFRVRFVSTPAEIYELFYTVWADRLLWLALHGAPASDPPPAVEAAYRAFVDVNRRIATAVFEECCAADGDPVHVCWQDYQLWLAPAMLRTMLDERAVAAQVRQSHFTHVPFPPESELVANLGSQVVRDLVRGLLGNDVVGFQTQRDAANFRGAAQANGLARTLDARVVRVDPFPVDRGRLHQLDADPATDREVSRLRARVGRRSLIFNTGRVDPAKDVGRSLLAFGRFLDTCEDPGSVVYRVQSQPSRREIAQWRECEEQWAAAAASINARYSHLPEPPVELVFADDMPAAMAGYRCYDVLDVVPLADGMNLVSLEGVLINRQQGQLVLARSAGSFDLLGPWAFGVQAGDLEAHAQCLREALAGPPAERRLRSTGLAAAVPDQSPSQWLHRQVDG